MRSSLRSPQAAFTLVELLVATGILSVMVVMLVAATDQAGKLARRTSGKVEQFAEARVGFEKMTRRLAEATLNTYWDYEYKVEKGAGGVSITTAKAYMRQSELRFRSGISEKIMKGGNYRPTHAVFFQAPIGQVEDVKANHLLEEALNTWGYFVEISDDKAYVPSFLQPTQPPRIRSRLMELRQPTERMSVYEHTKRNPLTGELQPSGNPDGWFADVIRYGGTDRPVRVMSENIVALVIRPRLSRNDEIAIKDADSDMEIELSPEYSYDSTLTSNPRKPVLKPSNKSFSLLNPKHQLPPVLQVVMVAVDELTAARLVLENPGQPDLGIQTDDLFRETKKLEDDPATPAPGDGDLGKLEGRLIEKRATYRIFTTNVSIRGAKWSKAQTN